jgi:hypothetical protein
MKVVPPVENPPFENHKGWGSLMKIKFSKGGPTRPFFFQDLDAEVIILVGSVSSVIAVFLAVQDDRWPPGASGSAVIFSSSGLTG